MSAERFNANLERVVREGFAENLGEPAWVPYRYTVEPGLSEYLQALEDQANARTFQSQTYVWPEYRIESDHREKE